MPAPGEQHSKSGGKTITNPFEEVKPRISEYTPKEIAALQSRLEKQLGPEYISSRAGPGGQKVHYVAAEKCIQLANEVFGFNGWSSQIMDIQVDFVDEIPPTMKVSLGLSVIVRVTLRDGTFHEDIGYGQIENCKSKAAAFEKAKKEGTTDGLKRALKNFGNVLGNCIYDKDYLGKVTKIKVEKPRWSVDNLHRHRDHTPLKKEETKTEDRRIIPGNLADGASISESSRDEASGGADTTVATEDTLEDEFGDFDEADFSVPDSDIHPDEVILPGPTAALHHFNRNGKNPSRPHGATPNQNRPPINHQPPMRPPNAAQNGNNTPLQPQTPTGDFQKSNSGAGQAMRPPQETARPAQPVQPMQPIQPVVAGRVLNQPSRSGIGPPSAPASPARLYNRFSNSDDTDTASLPPQGAGFFSARAAAMVPEGAPGDALPPSHINNLPAFNPHLESPSIKRTPGIDHKSSKPLTRDLKHVPSSSQIANPGPGAGMGKGNIVNPQLDATRRIGAPGMGMGSPMQNRGGYKPPTMKRPVDAGGGGGDRAPLGDLPTNGPIAADGGDVKRQKLNV